MSDTKTLSDFAAMSQKLGANPAYVQGGGGNTSVKLSKDRMAVKASGLALAQVTTTSGYANVDYADICTYLEKPDVDETVFSKRVNQSNISTAYRPSMEAGFHAVLDGCVVHTHSIYVNILTCVDDGEARTRELFPDSVWIPYVSPGRALTLELRTHRAASIFFLQNHGLVVRGETTEAALELHEQVNRQIQEAYKLNANFAIEAERVHSSEFLDGHILFPDQVIYTDHSAGLQETVAAEETLAAHAYILRNINELGLSPHFLQPSDAAFLRNMDSEKHRSKLTV